MFSRFFVPRRQTPGTRFFPSDIRLASPLPTLSLMAVDSNARPSSVLFWIPRSVLDQYSMRLLSLRLTSAMTTEETRWSIAPLSASRSAPGHGRTSPGRFQLVIFSRLILPLYLNISLESVRLSNVNHGVCSMFLGGNQRPTPMLLVLTLVRYRSSANRWVYGSNL